MAGENSDRALLAKAVANIHKTKARLQQLDSDAFPTSVTEDARQLLINVLDELVSPAVLEAGSPWTLFRSVLQLQNLVEDAERSHVNRLSWPIVEHCDEIWRLVFQGCKPTPLIFYTTTDKHNYYLCPFSANLKRLVCDLLPASKMSSLFVRPIYCLRLSAIENDNLPLYAIIAHEFGHAVFRDAVFKEKGKAHDVVLALWEQSFSEFLKKLEEELPHSSSSHSSQIQIASRRKKRIKRVLQKFAEELFADLFAALLFGHSYIASLLELSWGQSGTWGVTLSPDEEGIHAHPSDGYRLQMVQKMTDAASLCQMLLKEGLTRHSQIVGLATNVKDIPKLAVVPRSDNDYQFIEDKLSNSLGPSDGTLQKCCSDFAMNAWQLLTSEYPNLRFSPDVKKVGALLFRLEHDILPNILPNAGRPLLGNPADFESILLAAALHRLVFLHDCDIGANSVNVLRELQKYERLTHKAFEVTYVQARYNTELEGIELQETKS